MAALVMVGDSRAHTACRQTLHGVVTTTLTRRKVEEDTVATHHHHNAGHRVDEWGCLVDHACAEDMFTDTVWRIGVVLSSYRVGRRA